MKKLVASSGIGACATKRSPVLVFGWRKYGRKNLDALENRAAGIWLFVKGRFVCGSVIRVLPKFPASNVGLIANELNSVSVRILVSSRLAKKKALSFLMGPPTLPPNWLRRSFGRVWANVFRASNRSLRTN